MLMFDTSPAPCTYEVRTLASNRNAFKPKVYTTCRYMDVREAPARYRRAVASLRERQRARLIAVDRLRGVCGVVWAWVFGFPDLSSPLEYIP